MFLPVLKLIGGPVVALLAGVLLAMVTFGTTTGFAASHQTKFRASLSVLLLRCIAAMLGVRRIKGHFGLTFGRPSGPGR